MSKATVTKLPVRNPAEDLQTFEQEFSGCFCDLVLIHRALSTAEDDGDDEAVSMIEGALHRLIQRMRPLRGRIDRLASQAYVVEMQGHQQEAQS